MSLNFAAVGVDGVAVAVERLQTSLQRQGSPLSKEYQQCPYLSPRSRYWAISWVGDRHCSVHVGSRVIRGEAYSGQIPGFRLTVVLACEASAS